MNKKTAKNYQEDYTRPKLREKLKEEIKQGDKGGKAGQWSARKSQLLKHAYEQEGGDYKHKVTLSPSQKNLRQWSKEDWQTADQTKAGKGNVTTRYLPKKVWESLSPQEKQATQESKLNASKTGKQYGDNPAPVKAKLRNSRKEHKQ